MQLQHPELDGAEKVEHELFVAGGDPPRLFEAAHAALDHIALAIGATIQGPGALVPPRGNHAAHMMAREPVPQRRMAVASVARERGRALPGAAPPPRDPDRIEHGCEEARLIGLTRTGEDGERQSVPVADQVQLGAEAAATAPQRVIGRLAGGRIFFPPPPRPCARG